MKNFYDALSGKKPALTSSITADTADTSSPVDLTSDPSAALNTTFTMDVPSFSVAGARVVTPARSKPSNSYNMTPVDALLEIDNYDIDNLDSGDSTDDEDEPKKVCK